MSPAATKGLLSGLTAIALASACGGSTAPDPRYPARKEGCDVQVFHGSPPMQVQTDNLGPVSASCSTDVSDADCIRTLQDQTCKLGGDVVWGVPDKPKLENERNHWSGRAAHTKAAPPK